MRDRATIYAVEGDTWQWVFQCKDGNGAAYDFGTQQAVMQLRRSIGDTTPFADLAVGAGIEMDTPDAGSIRVSVPSDVTVGVCRGAPTVEVLTELKLKNTRAVGADAERSQRRSDCCLERICMGASDDQRWVADHPHSSVGRDPTEHHCAQQRDHRVSAGPRIKSACRASGHC